MNRSLIERVWILARKQLWILGSIVLVVVLFLLFVGKMTGGIAPGVGMVMFQFYLFHMIFEKESKNNGFCLLLSMPYKRREIVQNLYYIVWSGAIMVWLAVEGFQILLVFFINGKFGLSASYGMIGTGICFAISGIVFGILMPLYLKMDYTKATLYSQIILFIIVMFGIVGGKISSGSTVLNRFTYHSKYELLLALIGIIFALVSYPVSIKIFEKREF